MVNLCLIPLSRIGFKLLRVSLVVSYGNDLTSFLRFKYMLSPFTYLMKLNVRHLYYVRKIMFSAHELKAKSTLLLSSYEKHTRDNGT